MKHQVIEGLIKDINENNVQRVNFCEDLLAESIEEVLNDELFYSLPMENICSIIQKTKNNGAIERIIQSVGQKLGDDDELKLLNFIAKEEITKMDVFISIVSKFKQIPIIHRLLGFYEEKNLQITNKNGKTSRF